MDFTAAKAFLRSRILSELAPAIRHSLWARAFYQIHKVAQQSHWVIIRALAYKWIRILFRCWQERTPYDELRYLKSLQKPVRLCSHTSLNQLPKPRE